MCYAFFGAYFPGLFRPWVLICSVILGSIGLGLIALSIFMVVVLVFAGVFIGFMTGSLGLALYAQAAAWIVGGRLEMLPDLLSEFVSPQWAMFFFLFAIPFPVFYFLMIGLSAAAQQGP